MRAAAARRREARRPAAPAHVLAALLLLAWAQAAGAQLLAQALDDPAGPAIPPTLRLGGYVEVGVAHHVLTDGESDWRGGYLRGALDVGARNTVNFEVEGAERFDDQGVFFGLGWTHVLDPDWYTFASAGTSAGGTFYPKARADVFVNRKWLDRRQLVTTLGAGFYDAKDPHQDWSVFLGAAYYGDGPWIVEGGLRINVSTPGTVVACQPFAAVTYGRHKAYYVTVRVGGGSEAYQVIDADRTLVDFASQVFSVTWRQWVTRDWGFRVFAEHYRNPTYQRAGVEIGIFRDF